MDLVVEPLKQEELDAMIKLQWEAFLPIEANMLFPMIFPRGLQPDLMRWMRDRILKETDGGLGAYCYAAKDSKSGEIVAVSRWSKVKELPKTRHEIDAEFEDALKVRSGVAVEGMNARLDRAFFEVSFYSEWEAMVDEPYISLRLLATHPAHQRRGAGAMLLKHGLENVDRLGLPVYLDSGPSAKALYQRFGFNVVKELPLNCMEYGGRSDGQHWTMVRPAQTINRNAAP